MLECTGSLMVFARTLAAACYWSGGAVEIATCYLWDPCVECEGRRGVEVAVAKGCQCEGEREYACRADRLHPVLRLGSHQPAAAFPQASISPGQPGALLRFQCA